MSSSSPLGHHMATLQRVGDAPVATTCTFPPGRPSCFIVTVYTPAEPVARMGAPGVLYDDSTAPSAPIDAAPHALLGIAGASHSSPTPSPSLSVCQGLNRPGQLSPSGLSVPSPCQPLDGGTVLPLVTWAESSVPRVMTELIHAAAAGRVALLQ